MNKTVVMILGGAVLVAIIVALLVQAKLSPKNQATAQPTISILVAAKRLEVGAQLQADNVSWKAVPEDAVFPGAIRKSSEPDLKNLSVYGSPLRRAVEAGEPVTRQALIADIKAAGNMAATLMPGMRAVTIAVKADSGLSGFVAPGDRVDVILSYTPRFTGAGRAAGEVLVSRAATQTLINNVRVMGVDQVSSETNRQVKVPKTVTLEVSREEAERLVLARDIGKISLALRRLGETDTVESLTTPITTDITATEVQRKVSDSVRRSKTMGNTVRVYSGSDIQNVPVRAGLSPDDAQQQ